MRKISLVSSILMVSQTLSTSLAEELFIPKLEPCVFTSKDIALLTNTQYDSDGEEIIFTEDLNYPGLAHSKYVDGKPMVYYNPHSMRNYSSDFQTLVFYHEIGHFKLNHHQESAYYRLFGIGKDREQREAEANCYAIKVLKEELKCSPEQMKGIYIDVFKYYSDYFPGEVPGFKECLDK